VNISKAVYAYDESGGGDRVDAFTGPDGNVHVIVLDACGHGATAEKLANNILHLVKASLWQGLTPANVFRSLNTSLLATAHERDNTSFGSGAIVSINSQGALATFASAGHVDVLRFSSDGRRHYHHASTGPLYGVVREARYNDDVFSFAPGDAFVLVTDGLLDVIPIDNAAEFLGTGGVCRIVHRMLASTGVISAQGLISTVKSVTQNFRDDVAAIVAVTTPIDTVHVHGKSLIAVEAA
jgi:serine phosphatase RsbU (regulator of sigma subunit)